MSAPLFRVALKAYTRPYHGQLASGCVGIAKAATFRSTGSRTSPAQSATLKPREDKLWPRDRRTWQLRAMTKSDSLTTEPFAPGEAEGPDEDTFDRAALPAAIMTAPGRESGDAHRGRVGRGACAGRDRRRSCGAPDGRCARPWYRRLQGGEIDEASGRQAEAASAVAGTATGYLDRTDNPMIRYTRDMGRTTLLTREGEMALAKRLEAGQRAVLDALCESLPAPSAVCAWRDAIWDGSPPLR